MSILKRPGWNNYEVIEEGRLHNDKLKDKIGKMFDRLSLGYSPSHVVDKISRIIRTEKGDKFDYSKLSDDYIINIANSNEVTRGKFTPSLRSSYVDTYQNTNPVEFSDTSVDNDVSIDFTSAAPTPSNTAPVAPIPSGAYQEDSEEDKEDEDEDQDTVNKKEHEYLKTIYSDEDAEEEDENLMEKKKPSVVPKGARDRKREEERLKRERENHKRDKEAEEDAEEVDTCGCQEHDNAFSSKIPKENLKKINKESVRLSPTAINNLLKENYIKRKQHQFRYEERYRSY